jgi:hypothetical protein
MKVVRNASSINFCDLRSGQAFLCVDEDWIGIAFDRVIEEKDGTKWNCVDIETGELAELDAHDAVIALNAEVIIR